MEKLVIKSCICSFGNQLQFHVWWLTATKVSMIDYNWFEIGIKNETFLQIISFVE